jgi:DNA polymerase IV (DinB-like DNA polymerase)
MHVDFDYFFAQCEEIRRPELKSKPVVVCVFSGRTEESGAVSTANYIARKYGVKSGIPIKLAKSRLATVPDAVFLPLDTKYYSEKSETAMAIIESHAEKFEHIGLDECYIDVSRTAVNFEGGREIAITIKNELRKESGLTCSIGIASNKMLAKLASDLNKPDGLTIIEPAIAIDFISKLSVQKISGIGPKTAARLEEIGVKKIGDLREPDPFILIEEFGKKTGTYLHNAARGIDNDPVIDSPVRKQISRIMTLKRDAATAKEMYSDLYDLSHSVFDIADGRRLSFKTISVLLILEDLDQKSKSKSLKLHSSSLQLLHTTAKSILDEVMDEAGGLKVRRLGVRISDLQSSQGQKTMSRFMGG